jgi:uncharacterized membrane protein (DUF485 family)
LFDAARQEPGRERSLEERRVFRKFLLYGLPLYLYGLELLLKTIAAVNSDSVAGPTLAGAGIGFLLPLTDLKPVQVDAALVAALAKAKAKVKFYSPTDKAFTDFVWLIFFVSLAAWMYSIYLTLQTFNTLHREVGLRSSEILSVNWPLMIGCAIFVVAIILSEIKEKIQTNFSEHEEVISAQTYFWSRFRHSSRIREIADPLATSDAGTKEQGL